MIDNDGGVEWVNGVAEFRNCILNVSSNSLSFGTNNVAFLFTDPAYTNTLELPFLGGVSYTNNLGLNPRPVANSPALTNVLAGAPVAAAYRGAFSPTDTWADGWTGLSSLGFLAAVVAPPNPVTLTITANGLNVDISCSSQTGFTYTLESTTTLSPSSWSPAIGVTPANPQPGSGGTLTFSIPATGENYFRVKAN